MSEDEYDEFAQLLEDVVGLRPDAKPTTIGQKELFFRAMVHYDMATVRAAFDAHVRDPQRGRFAPMPSDLIAQIEGRARDDGRIGPEEAWTLALGARDETATVVWTAEIAEAWGAARTVLAAGDEVGARMAFREAYLRLVSAARGAGKRVEWMPSLGTDLKGRDAAIGLAQAAGLLGQSEPLFALPAPDHAMSMSNDRMPEHVRQRLLELRAQLVAKQERTAPEPQSNPSGWFSLVDPETLPSGMRGGQP